ncbi:hypothetical protein [Rubinisphaera italica]|uniref:hypothetical protein n=1 Tax=Rubinisphaera italica TaxID=2527969 RepID=UPI0011B60133|nr:hypothetical protein [Rubinisphaera italica]
MKRTNCLSPRKVNSGKIAYADQQEGLTMVAANLRNTVIARYGLIRVEHLGLEERSLPWIQQLAEASDHVSIHTLIPADEIAADLPEGFQLRMLCATDHDGNRRFYPLNGPDGLIADCAAGGLAILTHLRNMDAESRFGYRAMFELFRKVHGMTEHYNRSFGGHKDLMISRSGREDFDKRDVLPESLGQDDSGNGQRWGIESLKNVGRELSEEMSYERPSEARLIELGLFAGAKKNPLEVDSKQKIEGLIRAALYDGPPDVEPVDDEWDEIKGEITEQILSAIEKRLKKTTEGFDEWLIGPKNSFIKLIASRVYTCGPVTKMMVRCALLELGWKAYQYLADCIRAQMRCFRNALPKELNEQEQELFDRVYIPQEGFGGLPLVLIRERLPFLKASILAKFRGEDFDEAGVIHQLLNYYSEMVNNRREADRRLKQYSLASLKMGRNLRIYEHDDTHPVEGNGNRRVNRKPLYDEENHGWDD